MGSGAAVVDQLREHGGGIDLLVDTVGGTGLAELLPAMAAGGRVVLVGYTAGPAVTFDLPTLIDRDVSLLPLNLFRHPVRATEARASALELLRDGGLHLPVTQFALDETAQAVESVSRGETIGRVVLVPTPGRQPVSVDFGRERERAAA